MLVIVLVPLGHLVVRNHSNHRPNICCVNEVACFDLLILREELIQASVVDRDTRVNGRLLVFLGVVQSSVLAVHISLGFGLEVVINGGKFLRVKQGAPGV